MAKNKESIATIIPFYNGSKYLTDALDSLVKEQRVSDEIIIVNDESTKEETEKLDYIAQNCDLNIKIIHQKNTGQGGARNNGVKHTEAKFITFLDQDDMVLPEKNKLLLNAITRGIVSDIRCAYATADAVHVNSSGLTVRNKILEAYRPKNTNNDVVNLIQADIFQLPGATIFLKEAFEDVSGFDPRLAGYEDDDLFVRLYRYGYTGSILKREVLKWRINKESTSYGPRMQKSRLIYATKLLNDFPDDFFQKRTYSYYIKRRFKKQLNADILSAFAIYIYEPKSKNAERLGLSINIKNKFQKSLDEGKKRFRKELKNDKSYYVTSMNGFALSYILLPKILYSLIRRPISTVAYTCNAFKAAISNRYFL